MSKKPMDPVPEHLYPPDAKTPEERFQHLGRKLFAARPEKPNHTEAKPENGAINQTEKHT